MNHQGTKTPSGFEILNFKSQFVLVLVPLCLGGFTFAAEIDVAKLPPPAEKKIIFATDIQPIFENACICCHGTEKPKSKFSLADRTSALRGGENGIDIIPGDSAKSPLIHYVARLVQDMEMPPPGKGEPLTKDQIALLRAWIDQGAEWSDAVTTTQPAFSITPSLRFTSVSGDKQKFREHFWRKEGFNPGVEEFTVREKISKDSAVSVGGRAFPREDDYRVAIRYDKTDIGFVSGGVEEFRKYYDDSGGFYPFVQPMFSLNRDLFLRIGKAWMDVGLTMPDWPEVRLGYEYNFRKGAKSTLQWGAVKTTSAPILPDTSVEKNIFPAFKEIDEKVHILKLDVNHEVAGIFAEDNFRAEFYDLKTRRQNAVSLTQGQLRPSRSVLVEESQDETRVVNVMRLEKELRDWLFVSGGYLYSAADADAAFRQNTLHVTGLPVSGSFWNSQSILLSQNSHLFNANMRLGPWQDLTISGGVQSEWTHQEGVGRVSIDEGNPATFLLLQPATLDANLDRHTLTENVNAHLTAIPFTTLFVDARLQQENFNTFDDAIGGDHPFMRDSDAKGDLRDWRFGFYSSPTSKVSLGGHYRRRSKHTNYDHRIDLEGGGASEGYPAFILDRQIDTEEIEAKVTLRPWNWLKTTLSYQVVDTGFDSATDPSAGVTPGGPLRAGTFNANVYGINLILTPFTRWYFSGTFNYYDSRAFSSHNDVPSVVPYRGDIYSVLASATYMLNTNTDLTASYSFSKADYAQNNFAFGLPVGISYDWHALQAGMSRRFKNISANLQYGFFKYAEPSHGGLNDYTAHAVFATMTLRWR